MRLLEAMGEILEGAKGIQAVLRDFKANFPFHNDLDFIDDRTSEGNRVLVGTGKFAIQGRRAGILVKNGLVDIIEGPFGKQLELTTKGRKSLAVSRDAWDEI